MVEYFKGVKKEVSRIKWASKKDLLKYATSTIAFMIFFLYIPLLDTGGKNPNWKNLSFLCAKILIGISISNKVCIVQRTDFDVFINVICLKFAANIQHLHYLGKMFPVNWRIR